MSERLMALRVQPNAKEAQRTREGTCIRGGTSRQAKVKSLSF